LTKSRTNYRSSRNSWSRHATLPVAGRFFCNKILVYLGHIQSEKIDGVTRTIYDSYYA